MKCIILALLLLYGCSTPPPLVSETLLPGGKIWIARVKVHYDGRKEGDKTQKNKVADTILKEKAIELCGKVNNHRIFSSKYSIKDWFIYKECYIQCDYK
jgi:hypothetical protein